MIPPEDGFGFPGASLPERKSLQQVSGASRVCLSGVSFAELFGWCSGAVRSWPLGVLEPLGKGSCAGQGQLSLLLGLRPQSDLWLVAACAANLGWLPAVPGLGPFGGHCSMS